jgi:hypothetical protein
MTGCDDLDSTEQNNFESIESMGRAGGNFSVPSSHGQGGGTLLGRIVGSRGEKEFSMKAFAKVY